MEEMDELKERKLEKLAGGHPNVKSCLNFAWICPGWPGKGECGKLNYIDWGNWRAYDGHDMCDKCDFAVHVQEGF